MFLLPKKNLSFKKTPLIRFLHMLKELIGLKELQQILEDLILKNLMICTFIMG